MPQDWFIDDGTGVQGPVPGRELVARAAGGKLRPTDRVSRDGRTWAAAGRVKGLRFPPPPEAVRTSVLPAPDESARTTAFRSDAASPGPASAPIAPPPADAPLVPGYDMLGVLGAGAFGVVYKARQLKLDRVVALKTVRVGSRPDPNLILRFEKEAVALARLQHPNIVSIFDSGRHADLVFFAMELLRGEDLGQRLTRLGRLDERTAWAVARQTAAALGHAAAEGIFHRDVKPANLFLVPMPTGFGLAPDLPLVKVTDFGLVLTRQDAASDHRLTAAGTVVGTPSYMAPEQFRTPDVDHRADIYALGATVFHALSGAPPFVGATVWDVMMRKVQGPAPRLAPPVSAATADLVAVMLAQNPADRVADYADLIARIDALPAVVAVATTGAAVAGPTVPSLNVAAAEPTGLQHTHSMPSAEMPAAGPARGWRPGRRAVLLGAAAAAAGVVGVGGWLAASGGTIPGFRRTPVKYISNLDTDSLLSAESVLSWKMTAGTMLPEQVGGRFEALKVTGTVRRRFTMPEHFHLTLGLDADPGATVDVTVCVPQSSDGRTPDDAARRLVLRLSRANGAIMGYLERDGERFTEIGPAVPYPKPDPDKVPYVAVEFIREGRVWGVRFNNTLAGSVRDDGSPKYPEVRVSTAGGPVRINSAELESLAPVQ